MEQSSIHNTTVSSGLRREGRKWVVEFFGPSWLIADMAAELAESGGLVLRSHGENNLILEQRLPLLEV